MGPSLAWTTNQSIDGYHLHWASLSHKRPNHKLLPDTAIAGLGDAQQEVKKGMPKPNAVCLGFANPWEISEKFVTWAKTGHLYGKSTRRALGGSTNYERWSFKKSPGCMDLCQPGWWKLGYGSCLHLYTRKEEVSAKEQSSMPFLLFGRKLHLQALP